MSTPARISATVKKELKKLTIVSLAVQCSRVADDPASSEEDAETAWQMKREWIMLVAKQPALRHAEQLEIEKALDKLRARMVEFLSNWC